VPSLALGTGLVSPLQLAAAYGAFPGGGEMAEPRAITLVTNAQDDVVFSRDVRRHRVLSEPAAFQMTTMLRDVVDRGTGTAARTLGVRGPVAGKTGTTNEYHDAWFVGFSSDLVAAVWVGFDTPSSIGSDAYAARVAVPIWADFMKRAAASRPPKTFTPPDSLNGEELCRVSHLRPVQECETYIEYFKDGDAVPSALCPIHKGTFKQQATRVVQGVLRSVGGWLRGVVTGKGR
jgi:penicillin-binding protein 1A